MILSSIEGTSGAALYVLQLPNQTFHDMTKVTLCQVVSQSDTAGGGTGTRRCRCRRLLAPSSSPASGAAVPALIGFELYSDRVRALCACYQISRAPLAQSGSSCTRLWTGPPVFTMESNLHAQQLDAPPKCSLSCGGGVGFYVQNSKHSSLTVLGSCACTDCTWFEGGAPPAGSRFHRMSSSPSSVYHASDSWAKGYMGDMTLYTGRW